jgi:bifunctional DNase/RNase
MRIADGSGCGAARLTQMRVCRVDQAPEGRASCVVLEGMARLSTSMTIVLAESQAGPLVRALTLADGDCSAVCDPILAPVRRLEAAVAHAIIDDGPHGITAQLALGHDAEPFLLACDVADALMLAVRAQAPIYATQRVLDRAAVSQSPSGLKGTKVDLNGSRDVDEDSR